ncbi:unnamed protein product [Parascedosporium putredinis]|uniref:Uncharacterized protein n=1 Tax=Parascedosporium putredinis TaxID=1442378 RepID=A0A9P1MBQ3_9PEZI|nr:unnamed protein product [Parascedosporium putredinis]CAI7995232.1 unnamed protein product [Parascedosporium putredinis]
MFLFNAKTPSARLRPNLVGSTSIKPNAHLPSSPDILGSLRAPEYGRTLHQTARCRTPAREGLNRLWTQIPQHNVSHGTGKARSWPGPTVFNFSRPSLIRLAANMA